MSSAEAPSAAVRTMTPPFVGDDLLEDVLQPLALRVLEPPRDAEPLAVRDVDEEAAGQRDLGRQPRALRLHRILHRLDEDVLRRAGSGPGSSSRAACPRARARRSRPRRGSRSSRGRSRRTPPPSRGARCRRCRGRCSRRSTGARGARGRPRRPGRPRAPRRAARRRRPRSAARASPAAAAPGAGAWRRRSRPPPRSRPVRALLARRGRAPASAFAAAGSAARGGARLPPSAAGSGLLPPAAASAPAATAPLRRLAVRRGCLVARVGRWRPQPERGASSGCDGGSPPSGDSSLRRRNRNQGKNRFSSCKRARARVRFGGAPRAAGL